MEINNKEINKIIHKNIQKNGFYLVNVQCESEDGNRDIFCFTIGIKSTYNKPDIVMTSESPQDATKLIDQLINSFQLGLSLNEIIGFTKQDGEELKSGELPDEALEKLIPQIKNYYEEFHPDLKRTAEDVIWVGKKKMAYPFEYFLNPESERESLIEVISNKMTN